MNAIGINMALNLQDAEFKQKINEDKGLLNQFINSSSSGSPINSPIAANAPVVANGNNANSSGFLSNANELEVSKGILNELRALSTYFIRGNGNPAIRQGTQQQVQSKADNDKIKETIKTTLGTAALAFVNGAIAYNTGSVRVRMAEYQGDYFGSEIAKNNRTAGAISSATTFIPVLTSIIGTIFGGPAGLIIGSSVGTAVKGAVDSVVGNATENKNVKLEEQQLLSDSYKARLKLNEETLAMYGVDITNNSAETNATLSKVMAQDFNAKARNTGMELDEFQGLANQFASYGIIDHFKAGDLARASALTRAYTGADATDFLGIQSRLGRSATGSIDAMNYAYGASLSSGLGKGQFSEFLNGLQSAVEDGISNGFIRSTEDVSKTMVMFSKLSGNDPTLQGQYGFRFLKQMDNGLKNATNLQNTSHLLAFQSLRGLNTGGKGAEFIKGQDALNTLAYMEGGLDQDKFKAISKRFSAQYGGDVMENVLALKDLYGLNYNGAMKAYNMQQRAARGETVSESEIKGVMANPEFNSDQKNMVNYLNDIKFNTSILGEGAFRKYLEGLAGIDAKYSKSKEEYEKFGIYSGVEISDDAKNALSKLKERGDTPSQMRFSMLRAALNDPKYAEDAAKILNEFNSYGEQKQTETFLCNLSRTIEEAFKGAKLNLTYDTDSEG